MNTQLSHAESQSSSPARSQLHLRATIPHKVMIVLSVCMALQMTSFVMILPLFARRFSEFGAGVEALGASAMAYALTSTLAAPFMGALADRFGRRPLVLVSLAVYILAFAGYLFASSAPAFILLRGLAGAFTAGLIPAVTGIVADLAPTERRAQWIGIVNGGSLSRLDCRPTPGWGALRPLGVRGTVCGLDHHGSGDICGSLPGSPGNSQ